MTDNAMSRPKYWITIIIGFGFMFFFRFVPAPAPITPYGMSIIGVFIAMMFLTSTMGFIFPCFLGLFALLMTGGFEGMNAIIAGSLGNSIVFQLIVLLALSYALRVAGTGEVIARFLMTRKFLEGRPVVFNFMFMWAVFLAAIILTPSGGILFGWAIFYKVAEDYGYEKGERYSTMMLICLFAVAFLGGSTIPFGSMVAAMVGAFNEMSSVPANYAFYIAATIGIGTVLCFVLSLILKPIFKVDLTKIKAFKTEKMLEEGGATRLNKKQGILLTMFIIAVLYSFIVQFLPKGNPVADVFSSISQNGWLGIVFAITCLITVKGERIISPEKALKEGVSWGLILVTATFTVIGGQFVGEAAGIREMLVQNLSPVLSGVALPVFLFLIILITVVITNLMSNLATGILLISVSVPLAAAYPGLNIQIVVVACAFSAMLGFITPAASGMAPLLYNNEWVRPKDILAKGPIVALVYVIVATVFLCILQAIV